MASLDVHPPVIESQLAQYSWGGPTAPYAVQVYFGHVSINGVDMPGRDWLEQALSQINLLDKFLEYLSTTDDVEIAFRRLAIEFDTELRRAFEVDVYNWPRRTRRSNKRIVGTPRDIVDRGNLRDSQEMEFL